ncbi:MULTISPECIES: hypothetical protein [Psychrobacter]|jgi:hypothetical protein|uniref:hypothetical protein n=1 Tax=Psychrobacter TaxID=497 RepID=UPI001BB0A8F9|nr:hypothetical protein [Psychrobacter sp. UBA2514]|tara:strand:+ start:4165 stop:5136 length:972 start_codon:yes stop_codon:yes gene_type:complete
MNSLKERPILTDTYSTPAEFEPKSESVYVYGESDEFRSTHISNFNLDADRTLIEIIDKDGSSITVGELELQLRSSKSLSKLWSNIDRSRNVYIDITGMSHSSWSAILKSAIDEGFTVLVVYVEPSSYMLSNTSIQGQFYDLSEKIRGIYPLPGFANFNQESSEFVLIPILGFEGARFKYLMEQVQPNHRNIFPIVGLPGFRPWYIFESLENNMDVLKGTRAWESMIYVPSDCPFSCYYKLDNIYNNHQGKQLKIAPIGTKPHALAAIMYYLNHPEVEIIYDHPVRKAGRTDGTSKLHVYHVSALVKAKPDRITSRTKRKNRNV